MNLHQAKHIYFIGMGGVGVSAIARFALSQRIAVSGSDATRSPFIQDIERLGGLYVGVDNQADHIPAGVDLVVYSDACPPTHPELVAAQKQGLATLSFAQALGQMTARYSSRLAISGTNGKSTTTAMTGILLAAAGLDPTVFVGSRVSDFAGNLRLGYSPLVVVEADEYRDHFLHLQPTILAISNIEFDHPDYFADLEAVVSSFENLSHRLPENAPIIGNSDDPIIQKHWGHHPSFISVGSAPGAHVRWFHHQVRPGLQQFHLAWQGTDVGIFSLQLPGLFNVRNAAMAVGLALTAGAKPDTIAPALKDFKGIWRRFEILRQNPVAIINDYAHHPTAIIATIAAAREWFPNRRLVVAFQPHHQERLTALFSEFTKSFFGADVVVICETYQVLGRTSGGLEKNGQDLVQAITQPDSEIFYETSPPETLERLRQVIKPNDAVLIMGAGDIWTIAEPLAQAHA